MIETELPVNASSFDVESLYPSSGGMTALLRCRGSYAYFTASADPSGFARVDFTGGRVYMSPARLSELSPGDVLNVAFEDGEPVFTLERGAA